MSLIQKFMKTKNKFISALAVAVWILPHGEDPIRETRHVLDQWVETKQILSEKETIGAWKNRSSGHPNTAPERIGSHERGD